MFSNEKNNIPNGIFSQLKILGKNDTKIKNCARPVSGKMLDRNCIKQVRIRNLEFFVFYGTKRGTILIRKSQIRSDSDMLTSDADPGCLSRIRIFPSRISDPHSTPKKIIFKLSEISSGLFIPDPVPDFLPHSGSRGQKGT